MQIFKHLYQGILRKEKNPISLDGLLNSTVKFYIRNDYQEKGLVNKVDFKFHDILSRWQVGSFTLLVFHLLYFIFLIQKT